MNGRPTGFLVSGSNRLSVFPFAIHTEFGPSARAVPSAIRSGSWVSGSIRTTVVSVTLATQAAPKPTATSFGPARGTRSSTRSWAGSKIVSSLSKPFATQTAPSPAAIPLGFSPALKVATSFLEPGSISEMVPLSRFATQRDPSPKAMSSGVLPTWTCPTISPLSGSMIPTEFGATRSSVAGPRAEDQEGRESENDGPGQDTGQEQPSVAAGSAAPACVSAAVSSLGRSRSTS